MKQKSLIKLASAASRQDTMIGPWQLKHKLEWMKIWHFISCATPKNIHMLNAYCVCRQEIMYQFSLSGCAPTGCEVRKPETNIQIKSKFLVSSFSWDLTSWFSGIAWDKAFTEIGYPLNVCRLWWDGDTINPLLMSPLPFRGNTVVLMVLWDYDP